MRSLTEIEQRTRDRRNGQPALVLRAEAKTPQGLVRIKETIERELTKLSGVGPDPLVGPTSDAPAGGVPGVGKNQL